MKKIVALILVFVMLLSLCACVERELTPEEQLAQARRESEALKKQADKAQQELDDLRDAINEYEYWRDQVENAG